MCTIFREFPQTPRGKGFSLLGFYTLFKCIYDAWDRIVVNFEALIMQSMTEHGWFGLLDCAFVY